MRQELEQFEGKNGLGTSEGSAGSSQGGSFVASVNPNSWS